VRDGFCKQHHPDAVKARREAAKAAWVAKGEHDPMRVLQRKHDALVAQRDALADCLRSIKDHVTEFASIEDAETMLQHITQDVRGVLKSTGLDVTR
jgi:hypothetical protein